MFYVQKRIYESMPELRVIWARYRDSQESLDGIADQIINFRVKMPLIGAFSAGKSSLLNAFLDEDLLSVAVNPETTLATEIYYGKQEEIKGHLPDGKVIPLSREAVREQDYGLLVPSGWVEIVLPSTAMATIPHVSLVDMPGLASGNETHAKAIDNYIRQSLAYCVVISVDDGTLMDSTKQFLQELAIHRSPVLIVLTKSDKKTESDLSIIAEQIRQQVKALLGDSPFDLIVVSRKKKMQMPLIEALGKMEKKAEQRFKETVGRQTGGLLSALVQDMDTLINKDDLSTEQRQVKLQEQELEMQNFRENLDRETELLEKQIEPALKNVKALVKSRLTAELDSISRSLLNGSDVNGQVGNTVRLAVAEGIQSEFIPKVERYLKTMETELPTMATVNGTFSSKNVDQADGTGDFGNIATVIGAATIISIPWLAVAIPLVKLVLDFLVSQRKKDDEEIRKREEVREHVLNNLIPTVLGQVQDNLYQHLHKQVAAAKEAISADVELRDKEHKATMAVLDKKLKEGQAEFSKARNVYIADQAWVQQLLTQVQES